MEFLYVSLIVLLVICLITSGVLGGFFIGTESKKCPEPKKCDRCNYILDKLNGDPPTQVDSFDESKSYTITTKYLGSKEFLVPITNVDGTIKFIEPNAGTQLGVFKMDSDSCDKPHCKFMFKNIKDNVYSIGMSYTKDNKKIDGFYAMWGLHYNKCYYHDNQLGYFIGAHDECKDSDCNFRLYKYKNGYVITSEDNEAILCVKRNETKKFNYLTMLNDKYNFTDGQCIFYFEEA